MTDFKVGARVQAKRNGQGFQVRRGDLGTVAGTTGRDVYIEMDDSRGRPRELGSAAHYALDFGHARSLFEVVVVTPVEETMVPMSRVREVATRYAQANGWCGEVDRALAEIEKPKDEELVEVVYTATRKVTLKRKDLGKLRTTDEMKRLYSGVEGQMFASQLAPRDAKVEDNVWSISEPVAVKPESGDGWIDLRIVPVVPEVGRRVRVRPGVTATSAFGSTFNQLVEGTVAMHQHGGGRDEILVEFSGSRYWIKQVDLQTHSS